METDKLLTIPEVSEILRLSKAQVYILIQHRKIPHIRVSQRRVVIRETDLQKWINKNMVVEK